jgi:hypothetical protein
VSDEVPTPYEWAGTRLAVANSQPGAVPPPKAPVPLGLARGVAVPAGSGTLGHRGYSPGTWRTANPAVETDSACQRVPARPWPLVSKRSPATVMKT